MEATYSGYDAALLLIIAAVLIALIIERLLEIIKACVDVLEAKYNGHHFWNRRAINLQQRWINLLENEKSEGWMKRFGLSPVQSDSSAYRHAPTISAARLRKRTLTFVAKLLGIALGVCMAWLVDIDMFKLVNELMGKTDASGFGPWFSKTVTGIAMGLGAGPLHTVIARLEQAKRTRVDATTTGSD